MQKIVALLNDFTKLDSVLKKSINLALEQNALLEVIYVHEEPLFDVPDYFLSKDEALADILDKDKVKKEIQQKIKESGYTNECAIFIYIDDTIHRVIKQTKYYKDALLISAYHETLTHKLLKKSHLPLLVIKTDDNYQNIYIAISLDESSKSCINFSTKLFPKPNKKLLHDYRYFMSLDDIDYFGISMSEPMIDFELNQEIKKEQKDRFERLKKQSGLDGDFIEEDLSIEQDLVNFITDQECNLVILCSCEDEILFSNSICQTLLKELSIDILVKKGENYEDR